MRQQSTALGAGLALSDVLTAAEQRSHRRCVLMGGEMSVTALTNTDFSEVPISMYFGRLNSEIEEASEYGRHCSSGSSLCVA